jgi:cell division protein FtsB
MIVETLATVALLGSGYAVYRNRTRLEADVKAEVAKLTADVKADVKADVAALRVDLAKLVTEVKAKL